MTRGTVVMAGAFVVAMATGFVAGSAWRNARGETTRDWCVDLETGYETYALPATEVVTDRWKDCTSEDTPGVLLQAGDDETYVGAVANRNTRTVRVNVVNYRDVIPTPSKWLRERQQRSSRASTAVATP